MNEEKWVLAVIKRYLIKTLYNYKNDKNNYHYSIEEECLQKLLNKIAQAESDAVLGTPQMVEDYVNNLMDENTDDYCADCQIDFGEEVDE